MLSQAVIHITGHVGRDAEAKYTPQGALFVTFSVAVGHKIKDEQFTDWYRVTVWGKPAEWIKDSVKKGGLVQVVGRLQNRIYVTAGGERAISHDVTAAYMLVFDKPGAVTEEASEEMPF